jgi:hypothetical protein
MMLLPNIVRICIYRCRVGKISRGAPPILPLAVIFAVNSEKLWINFRGENEKMSSSLKINNKTPWRYAMKRRFTSNELFRLRNLIPIDGLIKENLNIPFKISEGYFRFLCPICKEFNTATNPKTNLARCFGCETNFNTIDLVMAVNGLRFIDTVRYLKRLLPETAADPAVRQGQLKQILNGIGKSV